MKNRFAHISGDSALDVLNTVDWRLNPEKAIEQFIGYEHVLAWAVESGFLTIDEHLELERLALLDPVVAASECSAFARMREDAYGAIVDRRTGETSQLVEWHRSALRDTGLLFEGDVWAWRDHALSLRVPRDRVVRTLIQLMHDERIRLLHQCEDDDCGWVYLDTSPRHNRRWCESSTCGDRNRARAYYRRKTRKENP